jgi:prephenate dehydratase/chorismate mutase/prephenate dehydratase
MNKEAPSKYIEKLDRKILKLLNDRMERYLIAKRLGEKTSDSKSEKALLKGIREHADKLIGPDLSERIFRDIIARSKMLLKEDRHILAFHGEHGSFSEIASNFWSKDCVTISCMEFAEIFDGVSTGLFDYGVIPVESTIGGTVGQINDLLFQSDLVAIAAVDIPIHHCLLALPGEDYRKIRYVHSDTQALAQCRAFSARNNLEPVPYYDSAGAAKWLSEDKPKASSVIASKFTSDIYQLEIIKENIEDVSTNRKRFFILSKKKDKLKYDKGSIVFSTKNIPDTLIKVLLLFHEEEMNITRIDSVPTNSEYYVFFLDFLNSSDNRSTQKVLSAIDKITYDFRLIGLYNELVIDHY